MWGMGRGYGEGTGWWVYIGDMGVVFVGGIGRDWVVGMGGYGVGIGWWVWVGDVG